MGYSVTVCNVCGKVCADDAVCCPKCGGEVFVFRAAGGSASTEQDNVNHPEHYTKGGIECIEAINASMTADEYAGYLKGNVLKYIWRYRDKGGVESLKKAEWCLKRLIRKMEEKNAHDK